MPRPVSFSLALIATLTACTTTPSSNPEGVYDPLEPLNRQVLAFNMAADEAVIGPAANAYETVTPGFFRTGVSNVLSNLNSPVIFANDILQGEPKRATDTAYRFLVNSTFGVLGLFDVAATETGIEGHSEDFGQTLGVWGVPEGPYLVLPLMGPSNLRDVTGRGVDNAFDPLNWAEFEGDDTELTIAATRGVLGALQARVALDEQLETLNSQPEPYVALRRAYTSQRQAEIRNGREEEDPYTDLPEFDDFE